MSVEVRSQKTGARRAFKLQFSTRNQTTAVRKDLCALGASMAKIKPHSGRFKPKILNQTLIYFYSP
jgi:hypothetical protein